MFPNESIPYTSVGEGENLFGGALDYATGRAPHPQLALTLSHLEAPDFQLSEEAHGSPAPSGIPEGTLALPQPGLQRRPRSEPTAPPPPLPPIPRRSWASGAGGRVLRPGALFTTRNKSSPSGSGQGVAAGSGPTPADPEDPRTPSSGLHPSPSRVPPLAPPSGLRVRVPSPLPSAQSPAHHRPALARRAERVPPAPSPHQPSGKLSNSRRSPQLGSPGPRRARGA